MRVCILWLLLSFSLMAQTIQGNSKIQGLSSFGSSPNYVTNSIMGLTDWNNTFSESNTILDAMQFTFSQFEQRAIVPNPTADNCTVVYNNKFYVTGGYGATDTTYLNFVQIYTPASESWVQGAPKTTAEWGAGCAQYNGKIYFFGGVNAVGGRSGTTNAEVYDIAGNSWSSLTALPSLCADGVLAVTVGNFIYVEWKGNFWKFDPSAAGGSGSYTALATAPNVEWAATGYVNVAGDDRIYYLGGSNGSGTYYNTVYYYSVTNSTWSGSVSTAPYSAHGQIQQAVYLGNIYYLSGFDGTSFYNTLYYYRPATNTWSSVIAAMNAFRDGVGGGFVGNTLFAIGGRNQRLSPFGMTANESYQVWTKPLVKKLTTIQLHYTQVSPTGNVELGIYSDTSSCTSPFTSCPGSLLLDAGSVAISNGWTSITGLNFTPTPGTKYWLAFIQSATNGVDYTGGVSFNTSTSYSHCIANLTFGALPSTFPLSGLNCAGAISMYTIQMTQ